MIIFNIGISCMCLWIIIFVYNKYILTAKFDRYKYKLSELKDRLTFMAIKGQISPESPEYTFLMGLINHSIKSFKHFEIISYIQGLRAVTQKKEKNRRKILKKIHKHSIELNKIAFEYYETVYKMIHSRKIRITIWLLDIIYELFHACRIGISQLKKLNNFTVSVEHILTQLEQNRKVLAS